MTNETITNEKDGSQMVKIPAGPFVYGSTPEKLQALFETKDFAQSVRENFIEIDERNVTIDAYCIDIFPITNGQYSKFLTDEGYPKRPKYMDDNRFGAPDNPVVGVDWEDAMAYAAWAGKLLPSEEQWEKAARGTDGRLFPWGDDPNPSYCNCAEVGYAATSPKGRFNKGRSPYEVEDMAGNIWEMTTGQWQGSSKTMRGGAFLTRFNYCHVTMRWTPADEELANGATWLGFRCVKPTE